MSCGYIVGWVRAGLGCGFDGVGRVLRKRRSGGRIGSDGELVVAIAILVQKI